MSTTKLRSPLRAEALKSLLGEIIPDGTGVAEVVMDHETFEMKSARISGALQDPRHRRNGAHPSDEPIRRRIHHRTTHRMTHDPDNQGSAFP